MAFWAALKKAVKPGYFKLIKMQTTLNLEKPPVIISFVKQYDIYLDDKKMSLNKNASKHSIIIDKGEHTIMLTQPFSEKQVLKFYADNSNVVIKVKPILKRTVLYKSAIATVVCIFAMYLLGYNHFAFYLIFWAIILSTSIINSTKVRMRTNG